MKKVKSMISLPDDVLFIILSKLSLKSLKRFTSVQKSWALLLENPHFMSMFRTNLLSKHRSYYDDTSLLLLQTSDLIHRNHELYLVSGDRFEDRVKLDWPHHLAQGDDRFILLFGSCIHGTFCLEYRKKLALWNPATQQFRIIPPSNLQSQPFYRSSKVTHGFGYDLVSHDFKVIRYLMYYLSPQVQPMMKLPKQSTFWEIYSLKSNSWKKLDAHMPVNLKIPDTGRYDMYMNGVCHWLGINADKKFEPRLVSFNLSNEVFLTTLLPSHMIWTRGKCLMALNGSIAVISEYAKTKTFHIWVLGELGVKESWTKLFIVGPLHEVRYPIGAGKKSDIFFRKEDNDLALFDLSTQTFQKIVAKGKLDRLIVYKKSILPIGRTDY